MGCWTCLYRTSSALILLSLVFCMSVYLLIFQRASRSLTARRSRVVRSISGRAVVERGNFSGVMLAMDEYYFHDTNHVPDAEGHVNPHPFNYIIKPKGKNACTAKNEGKVGHPVYLLVYIHSAPEHSKRRATIRETWGDVSSYSLLATVRIIFVLGHPSLQSSVTAAETLQQSIEREAHRHNDIVQEDFIDVYRNLTYKSVCAMRWITENCYWSHTDANTNTGPRYVLKADDDAFVNMFALIRQLQHHDATQSPSYSNNVSRIMCNYKPRRRVSRTGKWGSTLTERRHPFWPPFCLGLAYVATGNLIPHLYRKSVDVPFLWLDDVYVTGFLPRHLEPDINFKHQPFNWAYVDESGLKDRMLMTSSGRDDEDVADAVNQSRAAVNASKSRLNAAQKASQRARTKTRVSEAMFSHVHNLKMFIDVWKGLVRVEKQRQSDNTTVIIDLQDE